jgi:hypothetical protein
MASKYFKTHRQQYQSKGLLSEHKKRIEEHYRFLKCKFDGNVLVITGTIRQPDYKNVYQIEIRCVAGAEPCSKIVKPADIEPSKEIHMYPNHTLCLHYPPDMKWTGWTPVYLYTIPWVIEWVHYYEIYLINGGVWEGPQSPVHFTTEDQNISHEVDG